MGAVMRGPTGGSPADATDAWLRSNNTDKLYRPLGGGKVGGAWMKPNDCWDAGDVQQSVCTYAMPKDQARSKDTRFGFRRTNFTLWFGQEGGLK